MQVDGIPGLEFRDKDFRFSGRLVPYDEVQSIQFNATITRHSVNLIPTGKTYAATLRLRLKDRWIGIEPDKGMFGRLKKDGFEALQKAYAILASITFTNRVEGYEAQVAQRGFFEIAGFQLHRDGHMFEKGREVCSIRDPDISICLSPFQMTLKRRSSSMAARLRSAFVSSDIEIPLEIDRDCVLYMMKAIYGISFHGTPVAEKRVDRRKVFYLAVLRFGACLAKADGSADPEELAQLKRFFHLDEQNIPGAARIFNEELATRSKIPDILKIFAVEFSDADELKEGFLLGMLSVALADDEIHQAEFDLIRDAAVFLKLEPASFVRILLTAGIDPDLFLDEGPASSRRDGASHRQPPSSRTVHLRVLELDEDAGPQEIQRAYKRLVKRYHPDVLRGQGMPEGEIEKAGEILAKINGAYENLSRAA